MPLKVESTSIPEHRLSDGGALPLTFRDALPDNWGRLMLEAQYGRKLDYTDALLMTNADRIGAMVFSETLPIESNLPITNPVALEDVAEAVRRLELSMEITPDMPRLLQRGGTLGCARPKATFIHENKRWIANFLRKAMIMILNYLKYAYLSLRLYVALRFQQQSWKKLTAAMPLNDTAIEPKSLTLKSQRYGIS